MKLENVSKSFGKKEVLKNINLDITKNTAIIGLNGVGKTTLMNLCLGLEKPSSGMVKNDKSVSVCFSDNEIPEMLTLNDLFNARKVNDQKQSILSKSFNVEEYREIPLKDLSLGNKKKINIITSLIIDSEVLFMDEPTNGLDYISLSNLQEILKKDSRQLILISHDLLFIDKLVDEIIILKDSTVFDVISKDKIKEKYDTTSLENMMNQIIKRNDD